MAAIVNRLAYNTKAVDNIRGYIRMKGLPRFVSSRHLSHTCFLPQFDLNFLRLTTA
jgi:hypothetical protein